MTESNSTAKSILEADQEFLDQKHGDFTIRQLRAAFSAVANKENWKLPIDAAIHRSERDLVAAAIVFMTGSTATFSEIESSFRADRFSGLLRVKAPGYYAAVGA